jgi:glycolate oxidase
VISDEAYSAIEAAVGEENASRHPAVLDSYAFQPFENHTSAPWITRPVAVALPSTTDEVQEVVRACNAHDLKHKAFSTGWGSWCGPTTEDVVQVDLRRMNRIVDIDEKNMFAVVEPYVNGAQLQAEAMKLGLNTHIIGAGPNCSPLASATSGWGVGHDCIYMSYSPRNVLGLEWVQPTGEVLRLGALGSGKGWFTGDGPGPSLRGVMRGSSGALGGMGIFTRCALKLFNWPGPPEIKSTGTVLDLKSEVPENIGIYMCYFRDRDRFADAYYDIGEAEIGYNSLKVATPALMMVMAPHLFKKLRGTQNLSRLLGGTMGHLFVIVLAGISREDFEHQDRVLKAIVDAHDGFIVDGNNLPFMMSNFTMNFLRATLPALVFRIGGSFSTALSRNDSLDSQVVWGEQIADIKRGYAGRGEIIDDMGENPYFVPYENNMWAHCEVVYPYDHRKPEHQVGSAAITMDFIIAAIERCMEPGFGSLAPARKILSPLTSNYNAWQKKISTEFDPRQASDKGFYTDETDFDFGTIAPERVARLEELIESRTWTELGPPE